VTTGCKEQLNKVSFLFFIPDASSACGPFDAFHTSWQRLTAYHFTVTAVQLFAVAVFIQYFKLFWVTGIHRMQTLPFTNAHKKNMRGMWPTNPRETAQSKMLSPHCGCVVALNHFGKQYLVCLHVPAALTIIPAHHRR
jgi:hypothetical protein